MKKILAIIGSPRMGETADLAGLFEKKLKNYGEAEFEYIYLKDGNIQPCRGCLACFIRGEEYCGNKDGLKQMVEKMLAADGVIFATPVYSLQVSALLKNFIDRCAYIFHRPCLFDKAFIAVTTQGIYGDKEVIRYLNTVARYWGFTPAPGLGVSAPPGLRSAKQSALADEKTDRAAREFFRVLNGKKLKNPGFRDLIMFRMNRSVKPYITSMPRDYQYFVEKGWMESDYHYPVKLGPVKKLLGAYFDRQGERLCKKMAKEQAATAAQTIPIVPGK